MKKNVFFISMLKQPLRTAILVVLIALASFAFFLRTVEYVVVERQLTALGELYRSVGFVRPRGGFWSDISPAVDILENSPRVAYSDRRMSLEGILSYPSQMFSPDVGGLIPNMPRNNQLRIADAVFYGTVDYISITPGRQGDAQLLLHVTAHSVLFGLPEHINTRRTSILVYNIPNWQGQLPYYLAELEVGRSFIMRGSYYRQPSPLGGWVRPMPMANTPLAMQPIMPDGPWLISSRIDELDFTQPKFAPLVADINFFRHHLHAVQLMPIRDMYAHPIMRPWAGQRLGYIPSEMSEVMRIIDGRFISYDDYLGSNNVAVVSISFAIMRGVFVGDTITITIPQEQHVVGVSQVYGDFVVRGIPEREPQNHITLEIVGVFNEFSRGFALPGAPLVYIPLSIVPDDINIYMPTPGTIPGVYTQDHIPSMWYSFVLADTRTDQDFLLTYSPKLEALGFELVLFESNSAPFWAIIDPMLIMILFNAVIFCTVLALVLALVSTIFVQQRRKEMAIMRALGSSNLTVICRLLLTLVAFAAPAILTGGIIGWRLASGTAQQSTAAVVEMATGGQPFPMTELPISFFVLLAVGVIIALLCMVLIGIVIVMRQPVLEQLQGISSRVPKRKKVQLVENDDIQMPVKLLLPPAAAIQASGRVAHLRYAVRHITRAPVKTTLSIALAMLLVIVIGWVQESMLRTRQEIDSLYENTVVWGEVSQLNPFSTWGDREMGDVIRRQTISRIINTGHVDNAYIESGHSRAFVIPPDENGNFPSNWHEIIGYNLNMPISHSFHTMDRIFAVNDLQRFIYLNSYEHGTGLEIQFAPGFSYSDFNPYGDRIPVIMPQAVLDRRGLNLGDEFFIGFTPLFPSEWLHRYAIVIGVHNDHIARPNIARAPVIPLANLEEMLGHMTMYTTYNFTICTNSNRNIIQVREELHAIINGNSGLLLLQVFLSDQYLINMVAISNQTLLLLQLVYPIAMGAAILLAGGLAVLLMLQNAKRAATMHVLGMPKSTAVIILFTEHVITNTTGLVPALLILWVAGATFSPAFLVAIAILMAGIFAGAAGGAIFIMRLQPLELLQVKE